MVEAFPAGGKSLRDLIEGRSRKYLPEEDQDGLADAINDGELIFTAKVKSMTTRPIGMGRVPVHVVRVAFEDLKMIQGDLPQERSFDARKPVQQLQFSKGMKVLVVLGRGRRQKGSLQVTWITVASRQVVSLANAITTYSSAGDTETDDRAAFAEDPGLVLGSLEPIGSMDPRGTLSTELADS